MSTLSTLTLTFKRSSDYVRTACILHVFTGYVVWQSGSPLLIKVMATLLIALFFIPIAYYQKPVPAFQSLFYQAEKWHLIVNHGQRVEYDTIDITLDTGIFFLVTLRHEKKKRTGVVFYDQITPDQYRTLRILSKR